jgi:ferredoxin-NADP reductase
MAYEIFSFVLNGSTKSNSGEVFNDYESPMHSKQTYRVKVSKRELLCNGIVSLDFVKADGSDLPAWTPGAHVELRLPKCGQDGEDLLRQYSLCSDPKDLTSWKIAVLCENEGRGGSRFIHENLSEGDELEVQTPRNHFPFTPEGKCIFIAGGIGITPILPMVHQAIEEGLDWHLIYAGRSQSGMGFLPEIRTLESERVTLHFDEEQGMMDLKELLSEYGQEASVYSCGPVGLLDALEKLHGEVQTWSLNIERFAASGEISHDGDTAFDITIKSTGEKITIPADKSILEVLKEKGMKVESSCKTGVCGSCETAVLSGVPDHRDGILLPEEKAENDCMMICVSRALSDDLVLDI